MALSAADTWEIWRQSMKLWRISKVMPAISAQLPNSWNGYGRSLFLDVWFDVWKWKTTEQQVNIMV